MRFYTASKLGSKRALTPEGFLVCLDVPIARTGEMIYAGTELPELEANDDGLIRVLREADAVFDPEAMASFVGKPTTNDHPPEMVSPENFRRFIAGSAQNVRRGNADQDDLLFADLMFLDPVTIAAIEGGKDEISCGYDAEYEPVSKGVYRQVKITGNHVAVVAEGRCGPRCAIGDTAASLQTTQAADAVLKPEPAPSCGCGGPHHHNDAHPARPRKRKITDMATNRAPKLKGTMLDKLRRAFSAKDEAGFEEAMSTVEQTAEEQDQAEFAAMIGEAVATALAPIVNRLDAVEADVTDRKTKDTEAAEAARKEAEARDARRRTRDDAGMPGTQSGSADDPSDRFANGDPGYMGAGMGTSDAEDLADFLAHKGLSDGDIKAALALVKPAASATAEGAVATGDAAEGEGAEKVKGDKGGESETKDSAAFVAEFRDTVAKAEILAPGVKLPAFDAKAAPKATTDAICALRRRAVTTAFNDAARKAHVAPFLDSAAPDFSKMSCDAIRHVFAGASELAKRANAPTVFTGDAAAFMTRNSGTRDTIATMNAAAKELWKTAR